MQEEREHVCEKRARLALTRSKGCSNSLETMPAACRSKNVSFACVVACVGTHAAVGNVMERLVALVLCGHGGGGEMKKERVERRGSPVEDPIA